MDTLFHGRRNTIFLLGLAGARLMFGDSLSHLSGNDPAHDALQDAARHIYEEWNAGFNEQNVDRVLALYSEEAIIETPTVLSLYPDTKDGILHGKKAIRDLFEKSSKISREVFTPYILESHPMGRSSICSSRWI